MDGSTPFGPQGEKVLESEGEEFYSSFWEKWPQPGKE